MKKSNEMINTAIRAAELEQNEELVRDLLRVKQNEARRREIQRLADEILETEE
ncbi:MAG: hypothetical protein L7F78_17405 [Syntrophales bacterium LBB04]|nr:hypothetical protein [Syntrophales bacterium LBB04]